jgi:iron complex outermembrane receptor protein
MRLASRLLMVGYTLSSSVLAGVVSAEETMPFDLSLQQLLETEVTSVSRQAEPLSNAAAAVYVITAEEIRQRGFRSIPQALRDVPGLHVAQIDSQKWAVSSRGFNGRYNNKMLVLMDGRSLYSPEFSGVYWEVQDTLMADIERIEVIRGPGAAIWGANAVNGVINIITKHSAETLGGYAELGAGDYQQGFAGFRYGGRLAEGVSGRAFIKAFKRDDLAFNSNDVDAAAGSLIREAGSDNDWWSQHAGGRLDINLGPSASLMLSGAAYESQTRQSAAIPTLDAPYQAYPNTDSDSRGWHLLADYSKALSASSQFNLKTYIDHAKREERLFGFSRDSFEIEFSHEWEAGERHDLLWGMSYRHINNRLDTHPVVFGMDSNQEATNLWSLFIQDQITLRPDSLWLTLAARFEHHPYVDFEWQPTVRLSWQPHQQHRFWTALSRAVRTPSLIENNYQINVGNLAPMSTFNPGPVVNRLNLVGNSAYDSEEIKSFEAGYRYSSEDRFSLDTAFFYNDYDHLRSLSMAEIDTSTLPAFTTTGSAFTNQANGHNYGLEVSANWLLADNFKLRLNYALTHSHFSRGQSQNTDAPEQVASLTANWQLNEKLDFYTTWRYVDSSDSIDPVQVSNQTVAAYHGVDLGVNWQLNKQVTLSAHGRNLFYGSHVEYKSELFSIPYRVEPSFFAKLTVAF